MLFYSLCMLLCTLLGCILQQFLPSMESFYGARIFIFPLIFLCAASSVRLPMMLFLAFCCGFLWDAQHILGPHGGLSEIYHSPVESLPFGYSIFLFTAVGLLMQGVSPLFAKGKWYVLCLFSGLVLFFYLIFEFFFINFMRGDFSLPSDALYKMYLSSIFTLTFSPAIFWFFFSIAKRCGYPLSTTSGQKSRRF